VGWQDAVARARWVLVEWPERIGAAVPAERLDVTIAIDSPTARTFTFTGHGSAHQAALPCLLERRSRPAGTVEPDSRADR
jgi:tRNA A37 threonylcarbamoyladenosine biosynthesis protein TsaE